MFHTGCFRNRTIRAFGTAEKEARAKLHKGTTGKMELEKEEVGRKLENKRGGRR
jgi:hypothetical protein